MPTPGTRTQRGYGYRWQKLRLTILQRDGYVCAICHNPANTVDHIHPKIEGGTDDPDNLRVLCRSCNSRLAARWVNAHRRPKIFRGQPHSTPLSRKFASKPSHQGPTGALVD